MSGAGEVVDAEAERYEADPDRMLQPGGRGSRPPWRRFPRSVTITNPPCDPAAMCHAIERHARHIGGSAH